MWFPRLGALVRGDGKVEANCDQQQTHYEGNHEPETIAYILV